jgi:hypothetical protein
VRVSFLGRGKRFLCSPEQLGLGLTQPHVQWAQVAFSSGVQGYVLEIDHSSPSSAEVKNSGAIPPLRHISAWHSA